MALSIGQLYHKTLSVKFKSESRRIIDGKFPSECAESESSRRVHMEKETEMKRRFS